MTFTKARKRIDRLSGKECKELLYDVVLELHLISITCSPYFDQDKKLTACTARNIAGIINEKLHLKKQ